MPRLGRCDRYMLLRKTSCRHRRHCPVIGCRVVAVPAVMIHDPGSPCDVHYASHRGREFIRPAVRYEAGKGVPSSGHVPEAQGQIVASRFVICVRRKRSFAAWKSFDGARDMDAGLPWTLALPGVVTVQSTSISAFGPPSRRCAVEVPLVCYPVRGREPRRTRGIDQPSPGIVCRSVASVKRLCSTDWALPAASEGYRGKTLFVRRR
jgi:hypothetical protein